MYGYVWNAKGNVTVEVTRGGECSCGMYANHGCHYSSKIHNYDRHHIDNNCNQKRIHMHDIETTCNISGVKNDDIT